VVGEGDADREANRISSCEVIRGDPGKSSGGGSWAGAARALAWRARTGSLRTLAGFTCGGKSARPSRCEQTAICPAHGAVSPVGLAGADHDHQETRFSHLAMGPPADERGGGGVDAGRRRACKAGRTPEGASRSPRPARAPRECPPFMSILGRYIFRQSIGAVLLILTSLSTITWIGVALRQLDVMTSQGIHCAVCRTYFVPARDQPAQRRQ
jgi:hypothetical protein